MLLFSILKTTMSLKLYKEDGQGGIYNEDGSEAMDFVDEVENPKRQ